MSFNTNYISVNNPRIPVFSDTTEATVPFGKFIAAPKREDDHFEHAIENVTAKDMYLPNFSLRVFEGRIKEDTAFINQKAVGTHMPGSCLILKGTVKTTVKDRTDGPSSFSWSQNFKYDPSNELIHTCEANTDLHLIHFAYTGEYLNEFLPDDQYWADIIKDRIRKKERVMGEHFSAITLAQQHALKNIFNCPLEGKLGYMMIETSIIQIILIQMHSIFHQEFKQPVANRRDVETIQQLKEHLTKTFLEDHCLTTLARQFGTNTNKLMTLFKKIFGRSIFEFIGELRMDYALQLLRDQGLLVTEVARTIGYKNPNHFSCAFKKRYGVSPSELK